MYQQFGFNGKELDNEIKGEGNALSFEQRVYDPRLGKFLSVDPLYKLYPMLSTYLFAENTPIWAIDFHGMGAQLFTADVGGSGEGMTGTGLTPELTPLGTPVPQLTSADKLISESYKELTVDVALSGSGLMYPHNYVWAGATHVSMTEAYETVDNVHIVATQAQHRAGFGNGPTHLDGTVVYDGEVMDAFVGTLAEVGPAGVAKKVIKPTIGLTDEVADAAKSVKKASTIEDVVAVPKVSAQAAAKRMGFDIDEVVITDNVAKVRIGSAESLTRQDINTMKQYLRSQGVNKFVVDSGLLANPKLDRVLRFHVEKNRKFLGGTVTESSKPNTDFDITFDID